MPTAAYVSTGKPKASGAIYAAPIGTALPTDASTALNSAFKELGFVSDDGVTNNATSNSDAVNAWGGQEVLVLSTEKTDEWHFTLIEAMNPEVLKIIYGDANVTVNGTSGLITVQATTAQLTDRAYVIDMALKNNSMKRVVIPNGSLGEMGEVVYKDDEAIGYEITVKALPDANGISHYEYILPGTT